MMDAVGLSTSDFFFDVQGNTAFSGRLKMLRNTNISLLVSNSPSTNNVTDRWPTETVTETISHSKASS